MFVSHEIHAETFIRYTAALMQKPTDVEEQVIKRNRALAYLKTACVQTRLTREYLIPCLWFEDYFS
jgi:hypothetical protein